MESGPARCQLRLVLREQDYLPFLSVFMGPSGAILGIFSYSLSIVLYSVYVSMLGVGRQDDQVESKDIIIAPRWRELVETKASVLI